MANDTRARMVAGAARMIARRGVDAMSLRELAHNEGVPLGSTYHFFPGGKAALVDDAVNYVGDEVAKVVESTHGQGSEAIVTWVLNAWRRILVRSDFQSGCPVLAAAVAKDERHRATARAVFDRWTAGLTEVLIDDGVPARRASTVARMMIASLEGAVGLARACGDIRPLDDVQLELIELVRSAAGGTERGGRREVNGAAPDGLRYAHHRT